MPPIVTQGYDISFLVTNFHTENYLKHKLIVRNACSRGNGLALVLSGTHTAVLTLRYSHCGTLLYSAARLVWPRRAHTAQAHSGCTVTKIGQCEYNQVGRSKGHVTQRDGLQDFIIQFMMEIDSEISALKACRHTNNMQRNNMQQTICNRQQMTCLCAAYAALAPTACFVRSCDSVPACCSCCSCR